MDRVGEPTLWSQYNLFYLHLGGGHKPYLGGIGLIVFWKWCNMIYKYKKAPSWEARLVDSRSDCFCQHFLKTKSVASFLTVIILNVPLGDRNLQSVWSLFDACFIMSCVSTDYFTFSICFLQLHGLRDDIGPSTLTCCVLDRTSPLARPLATEPATFLGETWHWTLWWQSVTFPCDV